MTIYADLYTFCDQFVPCFVLSLRVVIPSERVSVGLQRKEGGTGLGLLIANKLNNDSSVSRSNIQL